MKTVLWITSMCLLLLFLLPIPSSCNAEHTALEDFSNSLKRETARQIKK